MPEPVLTAEEMLAWNERTAQTWRQLVEEHPEVLHIPCDIYGVRTVGELLQHVVAVETRYAQRLAGTTETPYDSIPCGNAAELFGAHEAALQGIRAEVDKGGDWDAKLEFQTLTMGRGRATRKTLFFHALMHSIRHYAQLATLVRQHGYKAAFPLDYMFMGFDRVD